MNFEPNDIVVGNTIEILKREMVVYDCDSFTYKHHLQKYGIDMKKNQIKLSSLEKQKKQLPKNVPPEWWLKGISSVAFLDTPGGGHRHRRTVRRPRVHTRVFEDYRMELACCDMAEFAWIDIFSAVAKNELVVSPCQTLASREGHSCLKNVIFLDLWKRKMFE